MDLSKRGFDTNKSYNLLFIADATFKGSRVSKTSEFFASVEGEEAFGLHEAGTPTLTGSRVVFSKYRFEPTEKAFIITKGSEVEPTAVSGVTPLLQLRTKTVSGSDTLATMEFQAITGGALFGNGVTSLKLFVDKNRDGKIDSVDQLVQSLETFSTATRATFTEMETLLSYQSSGDELYLLVGATLSMEKGTTFQFKVTRATLKAGSGSGSNIVGLPVISTKYTEGEEVGTTPDTQGGEDEGGCSVTTLPSNKTDWGMIALFAMVFSLFAFSLSLFKRVR